MTSQTVTQIFAIHILPNISGSKDNHAIKLGQLKEYNLRNNLFHTSCKEWGRETSSTPLFVS